MHGLAVGDRIARSWKFALLATSAALACALPLIAAPPASAAPGPTYITLGFDDGSTTQWTHRTLLDPYRFKATYFVNSGKVGLAGAMSWNQLRTLRDNGHEIGGHTVNHTNLTSPGLTPLQRRAEICNDKTTLESQGFQVAAFAYPDGAFDAATKNDVASCGYATARTVGGIDSPPACCEYAESLPVRDKYALRADQHLHTVAGYTLDDYKQKILRAKNQGGGWLQFIFHDVCLPTETACYADEYAVRTTLLADLLKWISEDPALQVRTSAQMLAISNALVPRAAPIIQSPLVKKPKPRIHRISKKSKRRVRVTVAITDPSTVRRVRLLVNGKVVRSFKRKGASRVVFTIRPGVGKYKLKAQVIDSAGERFGSKTRKLTVKRRR